MCRYRGANKYQKTKSRKKSEWFPNILNANQLHFFNWTDHLISILYQIIDRQVRIPTNLLENLMDFQSKLSIFLKSKTLWRPEENGCSFSMFEYFSFNLWWHTKWNRVQRKLNGWGNWVYTYIRIGSLNRGKVNMEFKNQMIAH